MSVNKAVLLGLVGQDPDIRQTKDGKEIASFSLATSESWKDKATGEKKQRTEWHKISVFPNGLVSMVKNYVKKGSKLYIEGQIQTKKYKDKEGVDKYTTEIVLNGFNCIIQMLDSKPTNEVNQHNVDKGNGYQKQDSDALDKLANDVPF